ncbi:MAG TPA: response regulator [Vicinamibacterales bacterium]
MNMEARDTGLRLLIVDDSATMRAMIRRAATLSGVPVAEIHEAENGAEALALLERTPVDAIFTDLNMPVMGGVELLRRLSDDARWHDVARVIISTDGSDVRRRQVQGLDVCHYLSKPVRPEAVCEVLSRVIAGR